MAKSVRCEVCGATGELTSLGSAPGGWYEVIGRETTKLDAHVDLCGARCVELWARGQQEDAGARSGAWADGRGWELYRLPDGTRVRVDATVSRGAETIGYTLVGGEVVEARAVR
jgi:hypothetical protein